MSINIHITGHYPKSYSFHNGQGDPVLYLFGYRFKTSWLLYIKKKRSRERPTSLHVFSNSYRL